MKFWSAVITILFIVTWFILVGVIINTEDEKAVMYEDFEALQEAYDDLYEGYNELQQDYSRKTEQIEYLEYRIMSDESISEELKQEIKENVPEEGE